MYSLIRYIKKIITFEIYLNYYFEQLKNIKKIKIIFSSQLSISNLEYLK